MQKSGGIETCVHAGVTNPNVAVHTYTGKVSDRSVSHEIHHARFDITLLRERNGVCENLSSNKDNLLSGTPRQFLLCTEVSNCKCCRLP